MAYKVGHQPKPGAEELDLYEQAYTRKGFFGSFAWLYKSEDPGRCIKADDELQPKHLDLRQVEAPDLRDADGLPALLLQGSSVWVHVSRRSQAMPFCWRNADADELHFIHRGEVRIETDFGIVTGRPGDFIYLPRNVTYRVIPGSDDLLDLIIEARGHLETAEAFHRAHGMINAGVDTRAMVLPELSEVRSEPRSEYEVKTKIRGRICSAYFDYDPVGVTVGWAGDPIVFTMNAWSVPAARSPFPPPTSAVFLTPDEEDCVVGVRRAAIGRVGAPGHANDWDEMWFLHSASKPGVSENAGDSPVGPAGHQPVGLALYASEGSLVTSRYAAPEHQHRCQRQARVDGVCDLVPRGCM